MDRPNLHSTIALARGFTYSELSTDVFGSLVKVLRYYGQHAKEEMPIRTVKDAARMPHGVGDRVLRNLLGPVEVELVPVHKLDRH